MNITQSPLTTTKTQPSQLKANIVLLVMLLAASSAIFLKPTQKIADQHKLINLETMIPKQFGQWRLDDSLAPLQLTQDKQALLNKIYNQTLSRTYIDDEGKRIMLSIAYGGDQGDAMQVHKPEVCYTAQGYQIQKMITNSLDTGYGSIYTKRLLATQGLRVEPITYWITVGDTVAMNSLNWKLVQLKYGLIGKIPDGLLFRVSSLGDEPNTYQLQEKFIKNLLTVLSPEDRARLIGKISL